MSSTTSRINAPHLLMREHPDMSAQVVSDALYGEEIQVVAQEGVWVHIKTAIDEYSGWVQSQYITNFLDQDRLIKINRTRVHIYSEMDIKRGPILTVGFGTQLRIMNEGLHWTKVLLVDQREGFIQKGDFTVNFNYLSFEDLVEFSKDFLGVPYLWGGRSSLDGYDCSGFTQMLYREAGILLPRDAKDQFLYQSFHSIEADRLQPGDLLFWGKEIDQIQHVGMYLGNQRFIHSTARNQQPWIQVSRLDIPEWNGSSDHRLFCKTTRCAKHQKV